MAGTPVRVLARVLVQAEAPAPGKLKEFREHLAATRGSREDLKQLAADVEAFASSFPMPGL